MGGFFSGKLVVTDLSHTVAPGMPFFPGTEPPAFVRPFTVASHGFAEQRITLLTHCGTHMDAPAHLFAAGATLEQLGLPHFVGQAAVVDLTRTPGPVIGIDELRPFRSLLAGKDFVLLRTGWSVRWGNDDYFRAYPVLAEAAALWLADFLFKGIGVDAVSFDPFDSTALLVHRAFLSRNIVLIENLTNLENLPAAEFLFCCLPLKLAEGDGAPVRAVALSGRSREKSKTG